MPPIYVCPHGGGDSGSHKAAQDSSLLWRPCDGGGDNKENAMSPRVVVAAEAERLLADAIARRPVCGEPWPTQEIVPVWLDDAVSYLGHL